MLEIKNLKVDINNKDIINGISLSFSKWKTYFLLGKNGSWKSSLAFTIAWHPKYRVSSWDIVLSWRVITNAKPEERSKMWIFLSFQSVPEIRWIKLGEYLRTIYNSALTSKNHEAKWLSSFLFKRFITKYLNELSISEAFLERDLNVGFSWWEKRKIELLQIKLLNPEFIILDEIDSGLDIDAFKIVAKNLSEMKTPENTLIFITHNFNLLDYTAVDEVFVMDKGALIDSWKIELIENIKKNWYCGYCHDQTENCDTETKCA
ncbi:MAG: FeS assembly ATPase SufC [uncultured bacterium (gcode 4)]|uniref:FeS assembly ATPase SufC n=1 Tax=uncultured bacterium (gcode 4) TaxID=1234023 RepID=K2FFL0_9BACT|nr:MAG: FeS assembly ATPase SufC [uncultured bacterium (gcode 4)]